MSQVLSVGCRGFPRRDLSAGLVRVTVKLTRDLTRAGIDARGIVALQRQGALTRIRYGAYSETAEADARSAHLQLIEATWPLLGENATLSHGSAAALHGLPLWGSLLERVSITRPDGGHGERSRHLHAWQVPLAEVEVATLGDVRVTSIERTAVDVSLSLPYERAVAVLDAALHAGADPALMDGIMRAASGRRGVRTARAALVFADGLAESVGESISRVRMAEVGLPVPTLQFTVLDQLRHFVARTDFCWRDRLVVGEFDGAIKYTGTPAQVANAVMAEKRREQAIRDAGWWVVRWGWADLANRTAFRERILTAFASAPSPR